VSSAGGAGLWTSTQGATLYIGVTASGTNSTAATAIENPALTNGAITSTIQLISFNDWLQSYQILCFNLHRLRLMDRNSACNILFSANYDIREPWWNDCI